MKFIEETGFRYFWKSIIKPLLNGTIVTNTRALTYYISPSGSDDNDGLSVDNPFKTIQKAINTLPKYIVYPVSINLAEGTYNEEVKIVNFKGGGTISLRGATDTDASTRLANASKYILTNVNVTNSSYISLTGFSASYINFTDSSEGGASYCRLTGTSDFGVTSTNRSMCNVSSVYVADKNYALRATYGGTLKMSSALSGTGNTYAMASSYGGYMQFNPAWVPSDMYTNLSVSNNAGVIIGTGIYTK